MPSGYPNNGIKNMGRPKGTLNKKTQALEDLIAEACPGFNPMVSMAKIAHLGTINSFVPDEAGNYGWITERIGTEHRTKCLTEVAQYLCPKRKAVEHSGEIATTGGVLLVDRVVTAEEWLTHKITDNPLDAEESENESES